MNPALLPHFAEQARFCEAMGSAFSARLIEAMAVDLAAGGPVAALVGDWAGSPRADAVSLRLTGALHAAVLSGRSPALAAEYPSTRPRWDAERVWSVARSVLEAEGDWVADFIRSPPQTNETRRAIALLAGFLELALRFELPLETLELGASAGLNLYWDHFSYRTASWTWGGSAPPVIDTDWRGSPPPLAARPRVRARAGCDLNPLDVADPDERLRLRAYIWPDQLERLARFDAALAVAQAHAVRVQREDAAPWLEERLQARAPDALTVVYHSVFLQYPPPETRQRIAAAIRTAAANSPAPLAWLRLEPEAILGGPRDSQRFLVDLTTWPGGERRILAETDGHARFVDTRI